MTKVIPSRLRGVATLLLLLGLLLGISAVALESEARAATQSWPMWGFNAARTRVGPAIGLPSGKPIWWQSEMVAQFGDLVEYPPSIAAGMLFYATNGGGQGGEVVARRLSDGAELWRYTVTGGGQFASQPAISGNVVYIGTMGPRKGRGDSRYKPELLALQADSSTPDGTLLGRYVIGHAVESSPLVVGNRIYVTSQDGKLYCFDTRPSAQGRLRQLWSRPLGAKTTASPAYRDGRVVVATYGGSVMAFDYRSGVRRWKKTLRGQFYGTPAIYGSRVIVASKFNGKIYCLAARTGTTMWSYATNQGLYASPAIWNNMIYIGSKYRCFWAIDVRSGKPKWSASKVRQKRYAGPIYGSATVLKGVVYFSTLPAAGAKHTLGKESGKTYAIDARSGKLKWSWAAGAYSPVTATSSLILLTGHHTIYAFKPRR
jgi:outer membrane protein assembly factor BamB